MNQRYAIFHFKLANGNPLKLSYALAPTSLRDRWINIVNRRRATNDSLDLKISNKTTKDLKFLMDTLNEIIKKINNYYDRQLPLFNDVSEITRETLNHLHEEFEEYGERHWSIYPQGVPPRLPANSNPNIWPGTEFKVEFHQTWMKLNQYIHITETALVPNDFPNFSCLVQYEPFERGDPVNPEDKLFLDTEFTWGQLYLGYNTLGKDWSDAAMDDDTRLVVNNQVKVQETFCSEAWLNFSDYIAFHKSSEMKFWNWYRDLPIDIQSKIPIENLSKLSLGKYYLGGVVLDNAFLNFHPKESDWAMPCSDLRKRWNLEVFSQITEAVGIEIL
jgi:hypothetical protein